MEIEVAIVTFPLGNAGSVPLANLVSLFNGIADRIHLISGGSAVKHMKPFKNVYIVGIDHRPGLNIFARIVNYLHTELKILKSVISVNKRVDVFVFFIGGETLTFPMLVLKLMGKKVIIMPGGIATKGYSVRKDPLTNFLSIMVKLNMNLADKLVVYSPHLISEGNWQKYQHKTLIAHEHFIDFARFKISKKLKRDNM